MEFMPIAERISQLRVLLILWFVIITIGFIGALLQFSMILSTTPDLPFETLKTEVTHQNEYSLATDSAKPRFSAQEVWIYDRNSEELLYSYQADVATAPASLVKMMTALVVFENLDLDASVKIGSASSIPGNRAKFLASDEFTVRDLLKAMLLFSANDAGQALASAVDPSGNFAHLMNKKAMDLHLQHSYFKNPTGLDESGQYSSANDLGQIALYLLKNPFLAETVSEELATLAELHTGRQDTVYTTNNLLHKGPQFLGIKTGTTDLAGQNLVFRYQNTWDLPIKQESESTHDKELDLVVVILGSQDRYTDALNLLDWLQSSLQIEKSSLR